MKLAELAKELGISTEYFIKFIQEFDLELSECIFTDFEVKEEFEKFARENLSFLKRYEKDLENKKSIQDIAEIINQPTEKVAEIIKRIKPKVYDNGLYRSSVSSYGIDNQLGGNYEFVYNYFGKKTKLAQRDFIGYRDLFFYLSKTLEPFINPSIVPDWGIHKPAGIILYGPPGSGKIFWANKIAEIIKYNFKEVKKYYFGTSFVNGKKTDFNDYLISMLKEQEVLLLLEDFDEIMTIRTNEKSVSSENEETKQIILHYIGRFEYENLLMVGSANSLNQIDEEILAPGRFDVLIPIFPPNVKERSEMILHFMTENLTEKSILGEILLKNNADHLPFWQETAKKMKTFSNTMILDFTQSLKKRLRNNYLQDDKNSYLITQALLDSAFKDASTKLTAEYLTQINQFIKDVSLNNFGDFPLRIEELKRELDHYKIAETPKTSIGFSHSQDKEQKK